LNYLNLKEVITIFLKYDEQTKKVIGAYDNNPETQDGEGIIEIQGFNKSNLDIRDYFISDVETGSYYGIKKEIKEPTEVELLQQDMGTLLLESANDKARISELETLTGDLILEIATLKGGAA
jgi:hypothetical protein